MTTQPLTHPSTQGLTQTDLQEAVGYDLDAMVSCTPLKGDRPVLPTKQVPYAKLMKWSWDVTEPVYVDSCLIVAKIEHRFHIRPLDCEPGDAAEIFIYATELEHAHGT